MIPIMRAYLVIISGETSSFQRLVMTPNASLACQAALDDVFAIEREKWSDEDQSSENPFWVENVSIIARNDAFNGSTGIITP